MNDQKRRLYIETEWKSYPNIEVTTRVSAEIEQDFAKLTAGQKVKYADFWMGGRVKLVVRSAMASTVERLQVDCEANSYFLETLYLNDEQKSLVDSVLQAGDLILFRASWTGVMTSGLFPKIESIRIEEIQLLAPTNMSSVDSARDQELQLELPMTVFSHKELRQWNHFLGLIDKFFSFLHFQKVQTPTLVLSPGLEPFIDPFDVKWKYGQKTKSLYLPTSPEFSLKKILCSGFDRIYEIKSSFRNEEYSPIHQPEFQMLEWYRAYSNLDSIVRDVKGLFNYLRLHWPERVKSNGPVKEITIAELFRKHFDFELTPETSLEELQNLCVNNNVDYQKSDDWDDLYFRLWLEKIEKSLGHEGPVIVRDYPPSQSAWAKINSKGWADRFEVYWRGVELGNAFHEVNDPIEQKKRFEKANQKRKELGKPEMPIDEELIRFMQAGMPPSGGIAVGLDRFFMLLIDKPDLTKTRFFALTND